MTRVFHGRGRVDPGDGDPGSQPRQVKGVEGDGYRDLGRSPFARRTFPARGSPGTTPRRRSSRANRWSSFVSPTAKAPISPRAPTKVDIFAAARWSTSRAPRWQGLRRHDQTAPRCSTVRRSMPAPPGRVFPGKRMSGHMGGNRPHHRDAPVESTPSATCPGAPGAKVIVRPSLKAGRLAKRKTLAPSSRRKTKK